MDGLDKIGVQVLNGIVQSIEAALIVHNDKLKVVFVNDAFEKIFEIRREKAIGRSPMEFLPDYDSRHKAAIIQRLEKSLQNGQKSPAHEFTYRCPSGRIHYLTAVSVPIFGNQGDVTHTMSVIHDLTQRKELELELIKTAKAASIADTAYSLAHEINNPLTGIRLGLGRLRKALKKEPNLQLLDSILNDLNRIQKNLQTFLRKKKRQLNFETVPISAFEDILEQVLFHLSGQCSLSNIRIQKNLVARDCNICVDRDRLFEVILNILLNSIEAIGMEGDIKIVTDVLPSENMGADPKEIFCVWFMDSGQGMAPEFSQKAFNAFYSSKEKGTGLGLSIARKVITAHQGSIHLTSELGKGTEVKICLPVVEGSAS